MCDYSLAHLSSRKAVVGDKLVVRATTTRTRGLFASDDGACLEAVCMLPGTEVAFDAPVIAASQVDTGGWPQGVNRQLKSTAGIFTQIDMDLIKHHDAFHFPEDDGQAVLINCLAEGQSLTVIQLPAEKISAQSLVRDAKVAWMPGALATARE